MSSSVTVSDAEGEGRGALSSAIFNRRGRPSTSYFSLRKTESVGNLHKKQIAKLQKFNFALLTTPFMATTAACAASAVSNETNPKPRDLPEPLS